MNQLKTIFSIAAVAVGLALLPMPYGYYMLMRLVMTAVFVYAAYLLYEQGKGMWFVLAATAVLYNPLIPIHLGDKGLWTIVNIVTLRVLYAADRALERKIEHEN